MSTEGMTHIQKELWPDQVETDPSKVAEIYNKDPTTYKKLVLEDGWDSSFRILNSELDTLVPSYVKEASKKTPSSFKLQILDAGCADGILTDKVDFAKHGADLHGFDIAQDLVDIARNKNKYVDLRVASFAQQLPYSADSFDFVIANGVLGYCDTNTPIHEFARILKPGGYVLFTMRSQHFEERDYPGALKQLSGRMELLRKEVFSAFPNNPNFKHEYRYHLVRKIGK